MQGQRPVHLQLYAQGAWAFFHDPMRHGVSLPWPTADLARALFEQILWKPRIYWVITDIQVVRPIQYGWCACPEEAPPLALLRGEPILALREVGWVIGADLFLNGDVPPQGNADNHGKYAGMFKRRLALGQFVEPPFFGLRAFGGEVSPVPEGLGPVGGDLDLGWSVMRGGRVIIKGHVSQHPHPSFA